MSTNAPSARFLQVAISVLVASNSAAAAVYKTPNFVVNAPSLEVAVRVARAAELYREKLASEWLGKTMPRWSRPCHVTVNVGQVGAGGATKFSFHRGHVFGWKMTVQGPVDRILDSVLPHEISHTIFACHFRRPLPRWADEGAATLAEDDMEKLRQRKLAVQVLKQRRRIPLKQLFAIKEYPQDMRQVMTLYAQGYSLADFLVRQGGKKRYLDFLGDAHKSGWNRAIKRHYEFENIDDLEQGWDAWVMAGSPSLDIPAGQMLVSKDNAQSPVVVRSQSPDNASRSASRQSLSRTDHRTGPWRKSASTHERTGFTKPIVRGRDLHAPDPRASVLAATGPRTRNSHENESTSATNTGRREAINAGWVPVSNWKSANSPRQMSPSFARPVSFVE